MKKHPFVVARRDYMLDAKKQIFADKRTKRARDRSSNTRKAIEGSKDEQ